MAEMTAKTEKPFWMGRKFWYAVIAAGIFLALALTGTVIFTSGEVMTFILGLLGINVTGHVATDVASIVAAVFGSRREPETDADPDNTSAAPDGGSMPPRGAEPPNISDESDGGES